MEASVGIGEEEEKVGRGKRSVCRWPMGHAWMLEQMRCLSSWGRTNRSREEAHAYVWRGRWPTRRKRGTQRSTIGERKSVIVLWLDLAQILAALAGLGCKRGELTSLEGDWLLTKRKTGVCGGRQLVERREWSR
jgi:hypothetical protein